MRILICDDLKEDLELIRRIISKWDSTIEVVEALTCEEAVERSDGVDCVIMDQKLIGTQGVECLIKIRALGFLGAFLLVTSHSEEADLAKAILHGADDFLLKNSLDQTLMPAINKAVLGRAEVMRIASEAEAKVKLLDKLKPK